MMRSLYSAITGLKNHQMAMDVIGNNISNVNTAGYKRSRTSFSTMLGQNIRGASAPDNAANPAYGGTNGIQIGLGASIGSIDKVMIQGSSQYTGKDTDMMIQGEGMFVLKLAGEYLYTRTGNFSFDKAGNLIDPSSGAIVQGWQAFNPDESDNYFNSTSKKWKTIDSNDNPSNVKFVIGEDTINKRDDAGNVVNDAGGDPLKLTLTSYSIDQSGVITGVYSDNEESVTKPLYRITLAKFANDAGLTPEGNNFYTESNNSGVASKGYAGEDGKGSIVPNTIEMSNVDLSQEFTDMIVTQRGFQANSRVITVSDTILQELIDLKRN